MITGILNSGFGHSVRFIALIESLKTIKKIPTACLAPECMKKFLGENVSKHGCKIYNLNHMMHLVNDTKKYKNKFLSIKDKNAVQNLQRTSIAINDFITQTDWLTGLFKNKTVFCSLYHGELDINKNDNEKSVLFKRTIIHTVNQYDIFFHINIQKPYKRPDLKCEYIPIPVISRRITKSKKEVKQLLGLSNDEKFILIHAGSAVMENVYKDLYEFYKAVNRLKTDYRIVISSSLENNSFPFSNNIIKAPLFSNGIDLVNASEMVISKPGMGILQDCIATRKPLFFLPGDFAERELKVKLLNEILSGNLPIIHTICPDSLKEAISCCLAMRHIYNEGYSKIPVNGADILAKSLLMLADIKKDKIKDHIHLLREFNPFMQ